ncbi:type I polyketide synthase [Nocardia sp. NPDC058518]|uniref:type I polyketide synthase n=1 Tax=Nocardia sp. NPDC058518 TaxID=3346534 RepID=UPI0036615DC5
MTSAPMKTAQSTVDVVGIDCRFPAADSPEDFWDLLVRGEHGVSAVPPQRWSIDDFYDPDGGPGRANTRFAGFIDDPETFDCEFFGIAPVEAKAMDIQQRMVLHTVWRALENAGLDPRSVRGSDTGVFVGVMSSDWGTLHLADYAGMSAQRGVGNGFCMIANRVSYQLDLRGPSLAVDTACSSSLVAVHMAASALRNRECDTAVVVGVNLMLTPALSVFYTQAGLSATDGRCRPFSGNGGGIGRGEGVGAVVLRRSEDRPDDAPEPYALIAGSAVGQDGRSNGLTAPTRWGQERVMTRALAAANRTAEDLDFIEGHGTGTTLGDMVEVRALRGIVAGEPTRTRILGSVKGNIGHCEGAAGIAGFIKACLALDKRIVPPTLFADEENPQLDLASHGLRLAVGAERLGRGQLYAGVSSFGLGGTNAHVVLASPERTRRPKGKGTLGVLTVTANNGDALARNLAAVSAGIEANDWLRQCYSSNHVKSGLGVRIAIPATGASALLETLAQADRRAAAATKTPRGARIVFAFTGQGAQYRRMCVDLMHRLPAFGTHLQDVDSALAEITGSSIIAAIESGTDAQGRSLDDTAVSQPALFAVQIALVRTFADFGVRPAAVIGHSVGEFAAAVCAGRMAFTEAARLVSARGEAMQAVARGGAMLAADCGYDTALALAESIDGAGIAAVNGPSSVVFAGAADAVDTIAEKLRADGVRVKALTVSHAFHSALMAPARAAVRDAAAQVTAGADDAVRLPMASTVTGALLEPGDLTPEYWARQVTEPVLFDRAARALADLRPTHVVEIGPRGVLSGILRASAALPDSTILTPIPGEKSDGLEFAATLASLWESGVDIGWSALYDRGDHRIRRLPGYVFSDGERFLVSAASAGLTAPVRAVAGQHPGRPAKTVASTTDPAQTDPSSVHSAVTAVLGDIGDYRPADLRPDQDLRDDLGFDSITIMQFADRIAPRLGLAAAPGPEQLHSDIRTVGELVELVTTLMKENQR